MAKKDWQMDLRGRQSVRTTFKLSKTGWDALSGLAKNHEVTFKDVFDSLCTHLLESEKEDAPLYGLAGVTKKLNNSGNKAWEIDPSRKTQVVSKGALWALKECSEQFQIPRDALVDSALKFYWIHCQNVLEDEREQRARAFELISDFLEEAQAKRKELTKLLDEDDEYLSRFVEVVSLLLHLHLDLEEELQGWKPVDE